MQKAKLHQAKYTGFRAVPVRAPIGCARMPVIHVRANPGEQMQTIEYDKTMVNTATLTGRLGRDPELRQTSKSAVASFSLAVDTKVEGKADWFNITVWGELAEEACQKLRKGSFVRVSGPLRIDEYIDRDSQKRTSCKVTAYNIALVNRQRGPTYPEYQQPQSPMNHPEPSDYQQFQSPNYAPQAPMFQQPQAPVYAPPAPAYQASPMRQPMMQGTPAPGFTPAAPSQSYSDKQREAEEQWNDFFNNSDGWWDNRSKKINPRAPDFKKKDGSAALWMSSKGMPDWVAQKLLSLGYTQG